MKKTIATGVLAMLILGSFTACNSGDANIQNDISKSSGKDMSSSSAELDTTSSSSSEEQNKNKIEIVSEKIVKSISSIGIDEVKYISEIKNAGSNTVKISNISIDLEDTNSEILKTAKYINAYPNVINPGESAYIFENIVGFGDDIDLDTVGKAILHYDITEKPYAELPNVDITETKLNIKYDFPNVVGRIENKGDKELNSLYIAFPIFDENSNFVSLIYTSINGLKPGDKKGFEQRALYYNNTTDYSKCTVKAIPYIYSLF